VRLESSESVLPQQVPPSPARTKRRILNILAWGGATVIVALAVLELASSGREWEVVAAAALVAAYAVAGFIYWRYAASTARHSKRKAKPSPSGDTTTDPTPPGDTTTDPTPPGGTEVDSPSAAISTSPPHETETPPPPDALTEPLAQRKDFLRYQPRPLDSRHSAYSLEQSGTNRIFVLAGSAVGTKHDQAGIAREDDVAFFAEPAMPGTVVAAVADGVSMARLSHLASTLMVRHAVTWLSTWLADPAQPGILSRWQETADQVVGRLAEELNESLVTAHLDTLRKLRLADEASEQRPGRPAATLAVVVANETPKGLHAWWFTVGDCDVVAVDFINHTVNWRTPRAYRNGPNTAAVPSHRQATNHGDFPIADGQAMVAMTDGMADVLDADQEHMLKALDAAHKQGNALGDLLTALNVRVHGNHDDRSLIAIGPISRK
jgi:hypothetical protein